MNDRLSKNYIENGLNDEDHNMTYFTTKIKRFTSFSLVFSMLIGVNIGIAASKLLG